jgi:hypothetical protein
MATLAEIRARLQEMESKSSGSGSGTADGAIYPFWNLNEGSTSLVRFLPDADPNNTFFWTERQMIKLTFAGIKGGDSTPVTVQVPCVEMFGRKDCPVLTQVRPWFKDPGLEAMGRKYWKKRSYVFQGIVVEDGLNEETSPENPVRRFVIGPQLFNIIKAALMDPDMEETPVSYDRGTDFRISKTKKGEYSDYSTSKWARKERALTSEERAAIDEHGLFNLGEYMPKEPTAEELQAISEMFEASVEGEAYDGNRWGSYYKPYGYDNGTSTQTATASAVRQAPAKPAANIGDDDDDTPPFEVNSKPAPSASEKPSTDAILAMIRNRSSQ